MSVERAVLVEAIRTPVARRNGALSGWHRVDLLGEPLCGLQARTGIDPAHIDDVIVGCVSRVGAQSTNIAHNAVLAAGWPVSVPGTAVDRQCGSAQQAIHFAAQGVMSGASQVVVAGGVESMSVVPMFSNADGNLGNPFGDSLRSRFAEAMTYGEHGIVRQGLSAERNGLDRRRLDEFAVQSHVWAAAVRDEGRAGGGDPPRGVADSRRGRHRGRRAVDGRHRDPRRLVGEGRGSRPGVPPRGVITAANSSQISDGAAVALITSESFTRHAGLSPLARLAGFSLAGCDPIEILTGPIPARRKLLAQAGLSVDDIDQFEINEAFAPVVLAWADEAGGRSRPGEREWWRDRTRPPTRGHRRPDPRHARPRA
jgi:acetyl-CoA acetyltransferase family protein